MEAEIKAIKTKTLNVRKPHECVKCRCEIKVGENAVMTTLRYDGRLFNVYICNYCMSDFKNGYYGK